jgi:hypothetical protein
MTKLEREALIAADIALTDWVRFYAADHCSKKSVLESSSRVFDAGGTLAYIADVRMKIKTALKGRVN